MSSEKNNLPKPAGLQLSRTNVQDIKEFVPGSQQQNKRQLNSQSPAFKPRKQDYRPVAWNTNAEPFKPQPERTPPQQPKLSPAKSTPSPVPRTYPWAPKPTGFTPSPSSAQNSRQGYKEGFRSLPSSPKRTVYPQYNYRGQDQQHVNGYNHQNMMPQHRQRQQQPVPSTLPTTLPHVSNIPAAQRSIQSFFINEGLRERLHHRTSLILQGSNPEDPISKMYPKVVHRYHSLYPLEVNRDFPSKVFGSPSSVYKCISQADGLPYVIRKVSNYRPTNPSSYPQSIVSLWKSMRHPNIVTLRDVFMSSAFDNINCLFFSYDYHPGATTLEAKYIDAAQDISEDTLWTIIIQICSALRVIHSNGLSCRIIDPSKIIETSKNRVRINCVGMDDVLNPDTRRNLDQAQTEDLMLLGRLIVMLSCKNKMAMKNLQASLSQMGNKYSKDLRALVVTLLGKKGQYQTVGQIFTLISDKVVTQFDRQWDYTDMLESELSKELENGRLFRLLVKLGFINERPENDISPNWSENGDRYLLKLFRDYTFHQVYEDGNPVIDFAHVVECLNKLDTGSNERLLLMSRNEKSMLVVTYKDLKRCAKEAFSELLARSRTTTFS
mmetsp:Transcript_19403/g.21577  ORF Transcript_19403/g.21577 Transcript_19403/m.21577 type:complete len:606 (+) Transcript_19403:95-1912(+)